MYIVAHLTRCRVIEPLDVENLTEVGQLVPGPVGEFLVQVLPSDDPVIETVVGEDHVAVASLIRLGPLPPPKVPPDVRPVRLNADEEACFEITATRQDRGTLPIRI